MTKTFKQRTEDWLSPLGYSIHSHNPAWTNITLMNYERLGENFPAITCSESDMTVNLSYHGLKMLVSLQCNSLAFEHKDIARFIDVMKYYADTCEENPPF